MTRIFNYAILIASLLYLCGCAVDSVGIGGSYTDESGRTYGGTVNLHLRDGKQVRPPAYAK